MTISREQDILINVIKSNDPIVFKYSKEIATWLLRADQNYP